MSFHYLYIYGMQLKKKTNQVLKKRKKKSCLIHSKLNVLLLLTYFVMKSVQSTIKVFIQINANQEHFSLVTSDFWTPLYIHLACRYSVSLSNLNSLTLIWQKADSGAIKLPIACRLISEMCNEEITANVASYIACACSIVPALIHQSVDAIPPQQRINMWLPDNPLSHWDRFYNP